jgi:hypothetical protein
MENLNGCQLPSLPSIGEGKADFPRQSIIKWLKRSLARPWNYHVKKSIKRTINILRKSYSQIHHEEKTAPANLGNTGAVAHLNSGEWVRVRTFEEIQATLNPFKELKGCAFLEDMRQYCGSVQRVLKPLERFLDERDYQVKRAKGIVLLEGVYCRGTPVFGRCDRSCLLFWREEWLEKVPAP